LRTGSPLDGGVSRTDRSGMTRLGVKRASAARRAFVVRGRSCSGSCDRSDKSCSDSLAARGMRLGSKFQRARLQKLGAVAIISRTMTWRRMFVQFRLPDTSRQDRRVQAYRRHYVRGSSRWLPLSRSEIITALNSANSGRLRDADRPSYDMGTANKRH